MGLETVGENMKQLEKSAEKALEREEKLVEKILSLQNKYKTTEARFEYGEMNITKLNQRIDDIEDEIYREKLKVKKCSDELDDTFDDMIANYWNIPAIYYLGYIFGTNSCSTIFGTNSCSCIRYLFMSMPIVCTNKHSD